MDPERDGSVAGTDPVPEADRRDDSDAAIRSILNLLAESLEVGLVFLSRTDGVALHIERVADRLGMGLRPGDRIALCDSYCTTMLEAGLPSLVVADARMDPAFAPRRATQELGIGAFSGVPLIGADGQPYGTLCALHPQARTPRPNEVALLTLAGRAIAELEELSGGGWREQHLRIELAAATRLRAAYAAMACGVVVVDGVGAVLDTNAAAQEILGIDPDRLRGVAVGDAPYRLLDLEGLPLPVEEYPAMRALRTGGSQHRVVVCVRRPDGAIRWVQTDAVPVPGEGGVPSGVVISIIDITAARRDREALRAGEARFRSLFEHAPIGMALLGGDGRILLANAALQRTLGYSESDLRRLTFVDVSHPDDVAANWPRYAEVLTGTRDTYAVDQRYRRHDGSVLWCHLAVSASGGRDGVPRTIVGMLLDVTERTLAERAMERARAAAEELAEERSTFVASVSHELRTPLASILGYAELLLEYWGRLADEQRRDRIERIAAAAHRQQRLVEDLLLIGRLDGHTLRHRPQPVPLLPLAVRAIEDLQVRYGNQAVALDGSAGALVLADPDRTHQVLANLLDNAAKYSDEGSPIDLGWSVEGATVAIRVRDRGPGIPPAGRERLFTRFGRLPGSRIRAGHVGTGLGLYIGRALAEAMGGDLDLEHTGREGSTFRLRLPLVAQTDPAEWPAPR